MQTSELYKIVDPEHFDANCSQDMPIYVRARTGMTYPVHYVTPYGGGSVKLLVLRTHTDTSVKAPAQITRKALREYIGSLDPADLDGNGVLSRNLPSPTRASPMTSQSRLSMMADAW